MRLSKLGIVCAEAFSPSPPGERRLSGGHLALFTDRYWPVAVGDTAGPYPSTRSTIAAPCPNNPPVMRSVAKRCDPLRG